MDYLANSLKYAGVFALLGAGLGAYSTRLHHTRRTVANLGLPDLVFLDQHDDVVFALDYLRSGQAGKRIKVRPLARAMDNLARVSSECLSSDATASVRILGLKGVSECNELIDQVAAQLGSLCETDHGLADHMNTVRGFVEGAKHNIVITSGFNG